MKNIFALILVSSFGVVAFADSFTMERNGQSYLCQSQQPVRPSPVARITCATMAYNGPFSQSQAAELCENARDNRPAECGIKAFNGPFSVVQAIELCKGVRTMGPVDCAIKAYNGPFSVAQALRLCKNGSLENADCAIQAYNGPYNQEQALQMCEGNFRRSRH